MRLAADRIQYHVDVVGDLFKALGRVIDWLIDSELSQQLLIFAGRGRNDIGAFPFCELHSEMAHVAAAAVNENPLSRLKLTEIEQ